MNIKCLFFGHQKEPWFATLTWPFKEQRHPDGFYCRRCGRLVSVYDTDGHSLVRIWGENKAPLPIDNKEEFAKLKSHETEALRFLATRPLLNKQYKSGDYIPIAYYSLREKGMATITDNDGVVIVSLTYKGALTAKVLIVRAIENLGLPG